MRQELWEADFESAETAGRLLGITFDKRPVKLMGGATRYDSDIRYSGFYSQGDGLSFVGRYEYLADSEQAIASEFGTAEELGRIARDLDELQAGNDNRISARITANDSRYVHKYTMGAEVCDSETGDTMHELVHDAVLDLMRDFAQWIYDDIRKDYQWRLTDEALDDALTANEYEFYEDGRRADY